MSTTIAKLQAVITADITGFTAGMNNVEQKIDEVKGKGDDLKSAAKGIGDAFTNLGATLTASLTAPITAAAALGTSFVDLKQKSLLAFQTMIGSATQAKALFGQLQQFAAATPFDLPGVVRGSQRLMAMGVAAKNVIPYMRILGDTTAAVGGGQAALDDITSTIGKISASATLTTERLNQLADAGIPIWSIMAQQMHTTVDKVRKEVESGAIASSKGVEMILAGLDKKFGGLMGQMGNTWSVTVSNLQDSAQQALGALFEPAINSVTKFIQSISDGFFRAKRVFEAMPEGLRTTIVVLLGVAAAAGPVLLAIGGLIKAFTAMGAVIEVIGGFLTAEIIVPIAIVAAAVAAFAASYRTNFLHVREITDAVLAGVWSAFKAVLPYLLMAWDSIKLGAQLAGQAIVLFGKLVEDVAHAVAAAWQSLVAFAADVWQGIVESVRSAVSGIHEAIQIAGRVFWTLTEPMGAVGKFIRNSWTGIVESVSSALQSLGGMLSGFFQWLSEKTGAANVMKGAGDTLDVTMSALGVVLDVYKGRAAGIADSISKSLSSVAGAFHMPGMPTFDKGNAPKSDKDGDDKAAKKQNQFAEELAKQQRVLRMLRQGESKDLVDLATQYSTIGLSRVRELLGVNQQIKGIEDEREKRKSLAESIKSSYASVRDAVLKARDGSERNTVAVDTYHQAWSKLTAAQKAAIAPTIALTVEQNHLNAAHEAAKKAADDAAEAAKKQAEEFANQTKSAYDAMEKARLSMVASAGATDTEKVAISQFGKELSQLPPVFRWVTEQITKFNAATADNTAITERTKQIAKLTAQYRDAIAGASDFDRFLTEHEVDRSKTSAAGMQSWHDLFDAQQLKDQGKGIDQMRSELQKMGAEYLHVSGATEEARLAMRYFGRDIKTLAPEVQAQIRKMSPDFEALEKYRRYREVVKQAGEQIKGVFSNAFEAVLNRSGNFFTNLITGFRQMLVKLIAEWAASKIAQALIGMWDHGHKGLADDAAKAAKNMVTGAAAISVSAALLDRAAKHTKEAANSMAASAGMSLLGGSGGGGAMSLLGMGGSGGMGSLLGSGFGKALPYLGLAEGADQLFFHGAITKTISKALGGIGKSIGKIFHFAEGSWSVPGVGDHDSVPAMLTPGEMVVPKHAAQGIREGSGWLGGDTHIGMGGVVVINDRADAARIAAAVRAKRQQKLRLA